MIRLACRAIAKELQRLRQTVGQGDLRTPSQLFGRPVGQDVLMRFGELVAGAASPIDDVRGSARYRRHALGVLASRSLKWAWEARCG